MTTLARAREAAAPVLRKQSSRLTAGFVRHYLRGYLARHFHAVRIAGGERPEIPAERPLLVYSNHPSWWDPMLFILLGNVFFPRRRGFGPMDAEALERYGFLKRLGVFGVERDTARGAARFLAVSRGILNETGTLIWLTPEGRFTDVRTRPIRFQPGLAHLVRELSHAAVLPVAIEYPFWNESKPESLARFGTPLDSGAARDRPADAWNEVLADSLSRTMDALSADAQARDPDRFETLISGQTGVGFFYDSWRRLKSWVQGRKFSPAHEIERDGGGS